ncbi:flavin reductase family protein [Actinomadura chibensis]|nr:flavin reductase family protein [Actinomadura chibensis]
MSAAVTAGGAAFRAAMARLPTGVSIVTTRHGGGADHGFTAGTVTSVSLDPPLVSVCVARDANCYPAFAAASSFVVSVAGPGQAALARLFATKRADKFAGGRFRRTGCGALAVDGARLVLECRVWARYAGGDHDILVGEVIGGEVGEGDALVFVDRVFGTIAS